MNRRSLSLQGQSRAWRYESAAASVSTEAALKVGTSRPVQVPSLGRRADQVGEQGQAGGRTRHLGDGDGAVHSHHRRRPADLEHAVQLGDLRPIGLRVCRRNAVQAGDRGLHLVGAGPSAAKHRFDQRRSLGDRLAGPTASGLGRRAARSRRRDPCAPGAARWWPASTPAARRTPPRRASARRAPWRAGWPRRPGRDERRARRLGRGGRR